MKPYYQDPTTMIYCGDCLELMPAIEETVDLIFADPPFNIGQKYDGYSDKLERELYADFTYNWLSECGRLLKPSGTLAVNVPDDLVHLVLGLAPIPATRIDWIIWHYRFGQCGRAKFVNSKAHCLVFVKHPMKGRTWNPDDVLVESDRVAYGDKRTKKSNTPGKRVPLDVWGVPSDGPCWGRVQGNSAERRAGHPNQLPEKYLERIIRAYSNPGDLILDPFGGSGTTAVVAAALGRRAITVDISEANVKSIVERLRKGAVRVSGAAQGVLF